MSRYIVSYSGSISGSGYLDTTYTLESKTLTVKYSVPINIGDSTIIEETINNPWE